MIKNNYNSKVINLLFWFILILSVFPRFLFYFENKKLNDQLDKSIQHSWQLIDGDSKITIDLPKNLESIKNNLADKKKFVLEKEVTGAAFNKFSSPIFVAGRIGDSDIVTLNNCEIGRTGVDSNVNQDGYWWNQLRFYKINQSCIKKTNLLRITIYKWGGPGYGIFGGPIGIGEEKHVTKVYDRVEYLWSGIFQLYGIILLAIGIYYLLIFVLVKTNKYNLFFSLTSLSIGFYELITTAGPYRDSVNGILPLRLSFIFACLGGYFVLKFFTSRFSFLNKKITKSYDILLLFPLMSLALKNFDSIYSLYQVWFIFYILAISVSFFYFCKFVFKNKIDDGWRYQIGFSVFFISVIHDILATQFSINVPYTVPFGFASMIIVVAITLAKEYADAFLFVEAQVGERTRDLSGALEQLKGLEKMKERFFANISHDLKTPITIALGAIEDTKGQFANVIGRVLEPADRSLRRLQDMVLSILDTVKAESGTLNLEWKSVKVGELLNNTVEPFKSVCRKEGVELKYSSAGFEGLSVPMDPTKIERVIENLLSNAFKFTKRTTRSQKIIEVTIQTDQSKVYIHIDDSGIGIPENEREKVFERYFQSSRTNLKEHGGSGIGLSFVAEMISLHNGKVYAQESPYHGTRMTVELPLSQNIENIQNYRYQNANPKALQGSLDVEYPPTTPAKLNPSFQTLLVAEDNPEVAQIVYSTLKDRYNIYFAENGKRALELLGEQSFDCVVSDIEMPIMTGDEFVENARKENKWKSIPIIMLSSHGDDDTIVKLLKAGANDYVQKPFRCEILLSRIQAQISANKGTTWNTKLEKLQELGQLVSGIGHQGKNRIGRIGSNFPLLIKISKDLAKKLEATQPEESKRMMEKITALGDLIGKGYDQTLDLFKAIDRYASGSDKKTHISIDEVVMDTVTLLEEKIRLKNISVHVGNLKDIHFDGYNEFREAILNIVSNAVDAVESGKGAVTIEAQSSDKEVFITITDNGCGIAKENLNHVFEPFFTSKQVGQGTGLGLYLARDAIELKNQGKLTISSKGAGQGVTVHISVPKVVADVKQDRLTMHNVGV